MDLDQSHLKFKQMKVCGICGDKALGYNFNAVTCEACKAFFRRNALRTKDFKCPFDGNCKIDLVTRRFCQKCRLKKCFDIGMKKEWILSEEEKKVKRDKILENRRRKESSSLPNADGLTYHSANSDSSSENTSSITYNHELLANHGYLTSNPSPSDSSKDFLNSLYLPDQDKSHQQNMCFANKLLPVSRVPSDLYDTKTPLAENDESKTQLRSLSSFNHHHPENTWSTSWTHTSTDGDGGPRKSLNHLHKSHHMEYPVFQQPQQFKTEPEEFVTGDSTNTHSIKPESSIIDDFNLPQVDCLRLINQTPSVISSNESETYPIFSTDKTVDDISILEPPADIFLDSAKIKVEPNDYSSDGDECNNYSAPNETNPESSESEFNSNGFSKSATSCFENDLASILARTSSLSLNYIESLRMEELSFACEHMKVWYHQGPVSRELNHCLEIFQVAEKLIEHSISMANMIHSFSELCQDDQIALLKYSITEILILRSLPCYRPDQNAWIFSFENNGKNALLRYSTCRSQISTEEFDDEIMQLLMQFPEICKTDRILLDLATMIVLFNPNRTELKHHSVVKLEYLTYRHLLCRYLDIHHSSTKGYKHFTTILELAYQLQKINERLKNTFQHRFIEAYRLKTIRL